MTLQKNSSREPRSRETFAKTLSSQQRSMLKGMAHAQKPVVQVGAAGLTDGVAAEIAMNLNAHELIKVQLPSATDSATKVGETDQLQKMLPPHAHVVSRIGRVVILYLQKPQSEEPKISLE